ncbi:MAG: cellulose 1,4-beta-cellobiosidase [Ruminococcus sp.]|nr:cellulose 1,4-beta-cellobiosidase [Ruminococcus sp.]
MISKKTKALVSAALAATVTVSSMVPCFTSAAGSRTKKEAFGDSTYAERFMSLYDDVVTNGEENGYLSKNNNGGSGSFGVPYHAAETVIVEAPDYGHETTSEAMSYIVWVAAMRDKLAEEGVVDGATNTTDLAKAWKTMEVMIPTVQENYWTVDKLSAQYNNECDNPEDYPDKQQTNPNNTGENPLYDTFKSVYKSDDGLYLMHWLADVDDWYGFGGGSGDFTFINTFQRGEQESCFETVPHPAIEELKYGMEKRGMKGLFNTESEVAKQWAYTNAPDAEDRAIQAVYAANRWGVGDKSVTALAGKMGDQLRNDMFDKYYKAIGCQDKTTDMSGGSGLKGQHFLRAWYTSWGGMLGTESWGGWAWQIGCSHSHEFYQNPLAAYGLLYDEGLNAGMQADGATDDYETSFQRQMELYLWLQSADGPIAGGCTNSYKGRYESYPSSEPTFYDMIYLEHPVYADPGSNHWIGNQVWAVQRLAELYYVVKTEGSKYTGKIGGLSLEEALEKILDRWVNWFVENTELTDDGDYSIPATLDWSGRPATWDGNYDESANNGLTCEITARGNADIGCVSSLANTLIYYAAATGTETEAGTNPNNSELGGKALYLAKELLDRQWELARDDMGLSRPDYNKSLSRVFEQDVHVPSNYSGEMPNGDAIKSGIKFIDIRTMYRDDPMFQDLEAEYKKTGSTEDFELNYHRFWHEGDAMMALGAMALLYPDMQVGGEPIPGTTTGSLEVTLAGDANCDGEVDLADTVLVKCYLINGSKYSISEQGLVNADVQSTGNGLNAQDCLAIQEYALKMIDKLPV